MIVLLIVIIEVEYKIYEYRSRNVSKTTRIITKNIMQKEK